MLKVAPARAAAGPIASVKATMNMGGNAVNRPRAADDFAAIRARLEELRREREGTKPSDKDAQRHTPIPRGGAMRWLPLEIGEGPGRVRQPGPIRSLD